MIGPQVVVPEALEMAVVHRADPDLTDLVKITAVFPQQWWDEIWRIAKEAGWESYREPAVFILRHSLSIEGHPPRPEGPEMIGGTSNSLWLSKDRLKQVDAEAKERGLSRNQILRAHFARGLAAHAAKDDEKPGKSAQTKARK